MREIVSKIIALAKKVRSINYYPKIVLIVVACRKDAQFYTSFLQLKITTDR